MKMLILQFAPFSDTFFDLTMYVCSVYIDYEEKWGQYTPLLKSNTYSELLWFTSTVMCKNFSSGIQ